MSSIIKISNSKELVINLENPNIKHLEPLYSYINKLSKENTFMYFNGEYIDKTKCLNVLKSKIAKTNGNEINIFATKSDKIVGIISLHKALHENDKGYHRLDLSMSVDSEFRGQKIGSKLLEEAIKQAKDANYEIIKLTVFGSNKIAQKLYNKSGFVEFGKLPNGLKYNGQSEVEIYMYLNLKL